jgi:hypothetical protein
MAATLVNLDRSAIAPLLIEHFPAMAEATGDQWHEFLNGMTGLDVSLDEPNGSAFDKWRQALHEQQGIPVWGVSPERIATIKAGVARLLESEKERSAKETELLERLRKEAPEVTAQDLVEAAVKAAKAKP